MDTTAILSEIDSEIDRLEKAKALLSGITTKGLKPVALGTKAKPRRKISAEGRARIAAAQKARWAKAKKKA
jgi:hypothetical protein